LLENSLSIPGAQRDALAGDDVPFLVTDPVAWQAAGAWVWALGEPTLRLRDVVEVGGLLIQSDMLHFHESAKIGSSFWPIEVATRIAASGCCGRIGPRLPHAAGQGGLTASWPRAGGDSRWRHRHREAFHAAIEGFWWRCTYVARNQWRIGMVTTWTAPLGFVGRRVPAHMGESLWKAIDLFRDLATSLAGDFGFCPAVARCGEDHSGAWYPAAAAGIRHGPEQNAPARRYRQRGGMN
jgi:hypothetical protein